MFKSLNLLKLICVALCLFVLISVVHSISKWTDDRRNNWDDACYLRQAHLFQRFGLAGIDTDLANETDGYLAEKLRLADFPGWKVITTAPCHTLMPASNKRVIQYPPGTGFVLAAFPQGFQVVPLYALTATVVFGFAVLAISLAETAFFLVLATGFGCASIYFIVNPTKASYSVAPTTIVCALAGYLTAEFIKRKSTALLAIIGLLIGVSVNFRLPNLFLSAGYFIFLLSTLLSKRDKESFWHITIFGICCLIGMLPTFIANAVNAGSPFSTTYSGTDALPPSFSGGVLMSYVTDLQFGLLIVAAIWTALIWQRSKATAVIVGSNFAANILYFATHPLFTPYYIIPILALSLWTLIFVTLSTDQRAHVFSE